MPHRNQSGFHSVSPPLRGESEKKVWVPEETRHTLPIWKFRGDPGPCPPPPSQPGPRRLAAQWHRRWVGLRHRPGPGFAKSRASAACGGTFAHGHALSAEAAPSDPLPSSCSSLAMLPNCSRPFRHPQLWRLAQSPSLPQATPRRGEEASRPGTPKLRAGSAEQTPILSPPLPSSSTPGAPARTHSTAPVTGGRARRTFLVGCAF